MSVVVAAGIALVGCSSSGGSGTGVDAGYVSSDGVVEQFAVADREDAPEFSGATADGATWSSADYAGEVMVVNFWYAACPPCRIEAPMLVALDEQYPDVVFVGVNVRDGAPSVLAFDEEFGIEYPSILDADDNDVQLAWSGGISPTAVPTTIVIGADGRIAARVLGAIPDQGVLASLIEAELER